MNDKIRQDIAHAAHCRQERDAAEALELSGDCYARRRKTPNDSSALGVLDGSGVGIAGKDFMGLRDRAMGNCTRQEARCASIAFGED